MTIIEQIWPQWKVEKEIGRGSYGVVYKCCREGQGMKEYAAIKVISLDPNNDPSFPSSVPGIQAKEFYKEICDEILNEAKLLQSLKGNRNIVEIKDFAFEETEDSFYLLIRMDLLESFERYLAERSIKEDDAVKLGVDLCSALIACHGKNIIHRDIKPKNILVDQYGNFELSDFGVAKKLEGRGYASSLKGNYEFMAPEVIHEQKSDARSDIYALGLVMYWLLNDRTLPFVPKDGITKYSDYKKAFDRRMSGEAFPEIKGVSKELNQAILKACQYKPENRFRSAEEFRQALCGGRKPEPNWKRFVVIAAAVLCLLFGAYALGRFLNPPGPEKTDGTTEFVVFPYSYDPATLFLPDESEYCDAFKTTVSYPLTIGSAYLYYGPDMLHFDEVMPLENGATVKVLSKTVRHYVLVKCKGEKGWVRQEYLSVSEGTGAEAEPTEVKTEPSNDSKTTSGKAALQPDHSADETRTSGTTASGQPDTAYAPTETQLLTQTDSGTDAAQEAVLPTGTEYETQPPISSEIETELPATTQTTAESTTRERKSVSVTCTPVRTITDVNAIITVVTSFDASKVEIYATDANGTKYGPIDNVVKSGDRSWTCKCNFYVESTFHITAIAFASDGEKAQGSTVISYPFN